MLEYALIMAATYVVGLGAGVLFLRWIHCKVYDVTFIKGTDKDGPSV